MGRLGIMLATSMVAIFVVYFERFYLHPTNDLIEYILLVTITGPYKPHSNANATSPPAIEVSTLSPLPKSGNLAAREMHLDAIDDATGGNKPTAEVQVPAQGQEAFTPPLRFSSKLHMINPLQLFTDYPVAYFLCVKMGFAKLWWVSANLVSLIHPFFGLAAGICIYRSAKGTNTTAGTGPAAAAAAAAQTTKDNSPSNGQGQQEMHRVLSSGALALTPKLGDGAPDEMGSPQGSDGAALVDMSETDSPTGKSRVAYMQYPVDYFLLRVGCCLFSFRNFLDSLDGSVARLQRRYKQAEAVNPSPPSAPSAGVSYGFNGHSVDVVTDLAGVIMCSVGIFFFMMRRGTVLSRYSQIVVNAVFRGKVDKNRMATAAKVVAVGGLLFMAVLGNTWENAMMRYSNLFDVHSPTDPKIWALEQDPRVRINQYFWSITCGDSVFSFLIVCLFFNKIWEAVQICFFIGYPWYLFVFLHTHYVWLWVVMENPTAFKIVSQAQV